MTGALWRGRLLTNYWFSNLPAALQDGVLDAAKLRRLTPGKMLFRRGDPPCGLYAVVEGAVRVGNDQEHIKLTVPSSTDLPFWFGEVSLFDGLPRTQDVFSHAHSIVLHIPQTDLERILGNNPAYRRQFASLLEEKLRVTGAQLEQHGQLTTVARVAFFLLLISQGYGPINGSPWFMRLPSTQLARWLTLSKPTLVSVLNDLQQRGVVKLSPDEIEIMDFNKLRAAAS
ncbi:MULTISPECIES: Crp/Fnr family transcriptional regulator [unclassified Pseudomonas]|uniref:Crp/Fnr family transcriptional regulator n=1 Tax=unclassified Pseudomonas TaxID=196821 RepID=UPI002AC8BA1A|nr:MULTISPECIES: Crp/Fnr family transcriptional regulator [unclassified Pseudomonas]MEB0039516.1 Crp/Fnr family transcriptional regulator [Pseudomonas sp. MH10]MEB0077759.1 Crp/Fnr family transcriptional regulator [Pseudomonas sp. MH10out]MEB0092448.1 Crp/Fnr family transcriptional regulator [Pseudomonas sp. CCI4.2]MEB0102872.1 Crp/Fnr family transcriptional regulator [Pseudomonas sp. CCI3.2]MEB0122339.1 Crp/Fnr family transcriptional regulator [Pseudomonas sp. CCI1.2]